MQKDWPVRPLHMSPLIGCTLHYPCHFFLLLLCCPRDLGRNKLTGDLGILSTLSRLFSLYGQAVSVLVIPKHCMLLLSCLTLPWFLHRDEHTRLIPRDAFPPLSMLRLCCHLSLGIFLRTILLGILGHSARSQVLYSCEPWHPYCIPIALSVALRFCTEVHLFPLRAQPSQGFHDILRVTMHHAHASSPDQLPAVQVG